MNQKQSNTVEQDMDDIYGAKCEDNEQQHLINCPKHKGIWISRQSKRKYIFTPYFEHRECPDCEDEQCNVTEISGLSAIDNVAESRVHDKLKKERNRKQREQQNNNWITCFIDVGYIIPISKAKEQEVWWWQDDENSSSYEKGDDITMNAIQNVHTLQRHTHAVYAVCISPDNNTIVSGSEDNTIMVWNADGKLIRILEGHSGHILCVCVSPFGSTIVSGSADNTIKTWSIKDGSLIKTLKGHFSSVISLCICADYIISGSTDETLKVWSVNNSQIIKTLVGHAVCLNPKCNIIASASKCKTISLWSIDSNFGILHQIKGHTDEVDSLCFSADGNVLISGSKDNTIKLWSVHNGFNLRTIQVEVTSICVSPYGNCIISASDRTIKIWSFNDGKLLKTLRGHSKLVSSVCIGNNNKIVSGSWDKTVKIWK